MLWGVKNNPYLSHLLGEPFQQPEISEPFLDPSDESPNRVDTINFGSTGPRLDPAQVAQGGAAVVGDATVGERDLSGPVRSRQKSHEISP